MLHLEFLDWLLAVTSSTDTSLVHIKYTQDLTQQIEILKLSMVLVYFSVD